MCPALCYTSRCMSRVSANFILLPMDETLLDQVLMIENASFPRPWSRQHFLDELVSPHAVVRVALDAAGHVVGYFCCRVILDEAELLDVAVLPAIRRSGIGQFLMGSIVELCRQRGAAKLDLEVRASNLPAIALYRQFGFTETGLRRQYYENSEDALLMQLDIAKNEEP